MQPGSWACILGIGLATFGEFSACSGAPTGDPASTRSASWIIPRPRLERLTGGAVTLTDASRTVSVSYASSDSKPAALTEGFRLLAARFKALGCSIRHEASADSARVVFERCSAEAMAAILASQRVGETLEPKRLAQAYRLAVTGEKEGRVSITASGELGLYYGLASLVQLVEPDSTGGMRASVGAILDWPEIALRLAKTSVTNNPPAVANRFAAWMPLYKISQIGVQFHGPKSLEPDENFRDNVKTICGWARRSGVCETVVYFCPFRGKPGNEAYDFRLPAHQAAYAHLLQSFLAHGAHGVEVDYNDWPGSAETPIEDVINRACQAVWEKDPAAYVFYCPPNRGTSTYRGPASPEMTRVLSKVPKRVWPLWTGYSTLITKPLETRTIEAWTRAAGRRPLLWVNRVSLGVKHEFGRPVEEVPGAHAFCGERLPKSLNRLFEGVHFNAGLAEGYGTLPQAFTADSLAYLATAADFVWNPHDWEAAESCRRARRFVGIMSPLLEQGNSLLDRPEDQ